MKTNHRLGSRIRYLRKAKGLSQDKLGKAVGLSQQEIAGIETGRRETTVTRLVGIADYFNVPLDFLVGRDQPPKADSVASLSQYNNQDISNDVIQISKATIRAAKKLVILAKKIEKGML